MPSSRLTNKTKIVLLLLLMSTVAIIMAGTTLVVLYRPALQQQQERLSQVATLHAQLIATLLASESDKSHEYKLEQTLATLALAYATPGSDISRYEIIIGKQQENDISYILKLNGNLAQTWHPPKQSMQKALQNLDGIARRSYSNHMQFLESYRPIQMFNLGIVARIDMRDFEAPYIRAGFFAAAVGLILLAGALLIAITIGKPMVKNAEVNALQLETILDTVVDAIITTDDTGRIMRFNPAAQQLFGYRAEEIIGKDIELLMAPEMREQHIHYLRGDAHDKESKTTGMVREITACRSDGSSFPADIAVGEAVINEHRYFTASIRDISKRKDAERALQNYQLKLEEQVAERTAELEEANEQLAQLASIDSLTNMSNRRVFDKVLKREMRRSKRLGIPLSLLLCDIDFFKKYNDSYGHQAGDECLRRVAQTIKNSFLRAGELSARYGGEEFAVILPAVNAQEASVLANKLREAVAATHIKHKASEVADFVTLSIGVATCEPSDTHSIAAIIERADQALYSAKSLGRNRVESALAA